MVYDYNIPRSEHRTGPDVKRLTATMPDLHLGGAFVVNWPFGPSAWVFLLAIAGLIRKNAMGLLMIYFNFLPVQQTLYAPVPVMNTRLIDRLNALL